MKMAAAVRFGIGLGLLAASCARGFHFMAKQDASAIVEISEEYSSNRASLNVNTTTGSSNLLANLSSEARARLVKLTGAKDDVALLELVAPQSLDGKPMLVPPPQLRNEGVSMPNTSKASLLESRAVGDFQPSSEFEAAGAEAAESGLPWGLGSPRNGDSLPVFQESSMPAVDRPKEWEYSLEVGDTIESFSSAQQDVKLITQVFYNVTNGFFLDTNAGYGERPSNTLLMELAGWRGLVMEPRVYAYMDLWSKFRKVWLFMGCLSPHENATKIGFDVDGDIDMLSGHQIHAYPLKQFMEEMGGRKTIDFWTLHSGGYEAEILNETILGSGKGFEFGVILVRWDGRRTGRGWQSYVQHRSKDETEEIIHEILYNGSYKYIGGLDAYWINHVSPRFGYNDGVWVNPKYFEKRGIPTPSTIKAAPPPLLNYPLQDQTVHPSAPPEWDFGSTYKEEIQLMKGYFKKSREDAAFKEPAAKAHRTAVTKLVY